MPRNRWLITQIWSRQRREHATLKRVEMYTYRDYGNIYRLTSLDEVDETFEWILLEAYMLGSI